MKEPFAPCKDCQDRFLGCHDHCTKYQNFKSDLAKYKGLIRQQKKPIYDMDEVENRRFEKYNKAKTRHDKQGAYN